MHFVDYIYKEGLIIVHSLQSFLNFYYFFCSEMKFSLFALLVLFCFLAFANAGPNDDMSSKHKPKPKPKPKKKPKKSDDDYMTMMPTGTGSPIKFGSADTPTSSSSSNSNVESTGFVAVLGGIAVACVVAIVAVLRQPEVQHEPLPDSSERARDIEL